MAGMASEVAVTWEQAEAKLRQGGDPFSWSDSPLSCELVQIELWNRQNCQVIVLQDKPRVDGVGGCEVETGGGEALRVYVVETGAADCVAI